MEEDKSREGHVIPCMQSCCAHGSFSYIVPSLPPAVEGAQKFIQGARYVLVAWDLRLCQQGIEPASEATEYMDTIRRRVKDVARAPQVSTRLDAREDRSTIAVGMQKHMANCAHRVARAGVAARRDSVHAHDNYVELLEGRRSPALQARSSFVSPGASHWSLPYGSGGAFSRSRSAWRRRRPAVITAAIRFTLAMSSTGSPSRSTASAYLPCAIVPSCLP